MTTTDVTPQFEAFDGDELENAGLKTVPAGNASTQIKVLASNPPDPEEDDAFILTTTEGVYQLWVRDGGAFEQVMSLFLPSLSSDPTAQEAAFWWDDTNNLFKFSDGTGKFQVVHLDTAVAAVDDGIPRFNGLTGKIESSGVLVEDVGGTDHAGLVVPVYSSDPAGTIDNGAVWIYDDTIERSLRFKAGGTVYKVVGTAA